jgi:KDO2-lipid IV(A) lauroyltransferase
MPKVRNDLIDRLQYVAFRVVSMMLQCWPVDANLRTAKMLGGIMYRLDRRHRERAMANLRRSFPEMSEPQREVYARRSMEELFMFFIEMMFTTRLIRIDTWAR